MTRGGRELSSSLPCPGAVAFRFWSAPPAAAASRAARGLRVHVRVCVLPFFRLLLDLTLVGGKRQARWLKEKGQRWNADAEIQVLKAPRAVVWKDFLGVNAQFLWFSPERYNKQIDRLQDLGLEWVRLDLHWDRLETAEDQYQLASLDQLVKDLEARQLKSVFYLVGSARFITTAPCSLRNELISSRSREINVGGIKKK